MQCVQVSSLVFDNLVFFVYFHFRISIRVFAILSPCFFFLRIATSTLIFECNLELILSTAKHDH